MIWCMSSRCRASKLLLLIQMRLLYKRRTIPSLLHLCGSRCSIVWHPRSLSRMYSVWLRSGHFRASHHILSRRTYTHTEDLLYCTRQTWTKFCIHITNLSILDRSPYFVLFSAQRDHFASCYKRENGWSDSYEYNEASLQTNDWWISRMIFNGIFILSWDPTFKWESWAFTNCTSGLFIPAQKIKLMVCMYFD